MTEISEPELERLRAVAALQLGDDFDDPRLQRLVDEAAEALALPVAAVSIVLDAAQYFIASHGLEDWLARTAGTPSEWAFCRHAVDSHAPFVVRDAVAHPLVADNPLVRIDGIRSYLGIPLITRDRQAIGTLCVLGADTREFDGRDIARLQALAEQVLALLEARRAAELTPTR